MCKQAELANFMERMFQDKDVADRIRPSSMEGSVTEIMLDALTGILQEQESDVKGVVTISRIPD